MPESPSGAPSCLSRCRELVGMDDGTAIVDGPDLPFTQSRSYCGAVRQTGLSLHVENLR